MNSTRTTTPSRIPARADRLVLIATIAVMTGCSAKTVDFSTIVRPERASQLDAYEVFVGSWTWEAVMLNAAPDNKRWTGTAEWEWALDKRSLTGHVSAKSQDAEYAAAGIWSWHPRSERYVWWMFNNWGYPQEGKATYDEETRMWHMKYHSIGLDGTPSHGQYRITVVDNDTLEWDLSEWADPLHFIKKMEMQGTYKRKK